ncbi:MAG: DUF2231 domain-containing protein [Phycisphaerales bacterium JB059]
MNLFPPMPNWEAAHPLVVHAPLALLMLAWAPMVIGLVDFRRRWVWMVGALLMLLAGTALAFVAVMSGEATEEKAVITSQVVERAVHEHEEMGELARTMFVVATGVFVVVLGLGAGMKKGKGRTGAVVVGALVFLGVYGYAATRLAWAGHLGAELVHGYGVRAPMAPSTPAVSPGGEGAETDDD